MLKLHKSPKNKSQENAGEDLERILENFRNDKEISPELKEFKEHFRGQEELILDLLYFVFFTGSMNLADSYVKHGKEEESTHDITNRLAFLEEDVRKMKRKVKNL
ncbi:hypothetical protein [Candidatus Neptunichlamydia sp. REUL1]|uniref:hypothetical protein n=1 Tax=Candidatus Neptunichlamydia sp. REUL1 TaxID=3064277 RepID=UPI00293130A8|nr:hypothetical protein [Candidatus Neptunochlamydia sp. REUL1]